jgi:hypothetical protein
VKDLHVWYELRRFGFGHAGYATVDGVSFDLKKKPQQLSVRVDAVNPA